jgi:hypothetical protein
MTHRQARQDHQHEVSTPEIAQPPIYRFTAGLVLSALDCSTLYRDETNQLALISILIQLPSTSSDSCP